MNKANTDKISNTITYKIIIEYTRLGNKTYKIRPIIIEVLLVTTMNTIVTAIVRGG